MGSSFRPSDTLTGHLRAGKLITPAELARCGRQVRRLGRDLPPSDLLWLDVLVQRGHLTPHQADWLANDPERLHLGAYLLREPVVGAKPETAWSAITPDGRPVHIKRLTDAGNGHEVDLSHVRDLIELGKRVGSERLGLPEAVFVHDGGVFVVSHDVGGENLWDRLVRRGRFPIEVVESIARSLIETLGDAERVGLLHGSLKLPHVRLTKTGVHLVETGLEPIRHPVVFPSGSACAFDYAGIAPERIGSGKRANVRSEMVSLGWMLWHLLAGRPPLLIGDPVGLLAAQRVTRIPTVDEFAPETPERLVRLIEALTDPDPTRRPPNFVELAPYWRPQRGGGVRLKRFDRSGARPVFGDSPRSETSSRRTIGKVAIAATMVIALGVTVSDRWGGQTESGSVDHSRPQTGINAAIAADAATNFEGNQPGPSMPSPLPEADADGVITLSPGRYRGDELARRGSLRIVCPVDRATIELSDASWKIWSESVYLENLDFVWRTGSSTDSSISTVVQSEQLTLVGCRFLRAEAKSGLAIAWRPLDPESRSPRQITVRDCHWDGPLTGLFLETPSDQISIANCLKTGLGPLLRFGAAAESARDCPITLTGVTLRSSGSLVRCPVDRSRTGRLPLELIGCVIAPAFDQVPLIELLANEPPRDIGERFEITGEGTLTRLPIRIAGWRPSALGPMADLPETAIPVEGLSGSPFEFMRASVADQSPQTTWTGSRLKQFQAPFRTGQVPGIGPWGASNPMP